jgi:hypothetical protein
MPESPRKQSTEHYGLGQSGYTAGRVENDLSLELQIEDRNVSPPNRTGGAVDSIGDDDRFTGRGGRPWVPHEPTDGKNPKE